MTGHKALDDWTGRDLPPAFVNLVEANPGLLDEATPENRAAWFEICSTAPHLNGRKAREFFMQAHKEVQALTDHPLRNVILQWALNLSLVSWILLSSYFKAVKKLGQDETFIAQWAELVRRAARLDIDLALTIIDLSPVALETFGPEGMGLWGELAMEAAAAERSMWKAAQAYLEQSASQQCTVPWDRWRFLLSQAARISPEYLGASEAFIRSGARSCMILTDEELARWVDDGLEMARGVKPEVYEGFMKRGMGARRRDPDKITSYFSGVSLDSLLKRDHLASGVALKDKANTLNLICEAFLGASVKIRDNKSLLGVKGFSGGAATDGLTIFLPSNLPYFGAYKLMALHQTALLAEGVWQARAGEDDFKAVVSHLRADQRLLDRLPGLRSDMERMTNDALPGYYPKNVPHNYRLPMPWWGDLLSDLVRETRTTISRLKVKAEDEIDLPPELIEALLSSMIADGERDPDSLWGRLCEMFDAVEFISPDAEELQENFKTFFYKEWDTGLGDYKLDWVLVRQRFPKPDPNDFVEKVMNKHSGLVSLIRRQFTRLKPEQFKRYRAQPYGDQIDIDALVDAIVGMRSGSFLSDSIYIRRDKRVRDVGVLFLLDLSGSTEEMVENRRVIDIQKDAMVLMAEALAVLGDPYSIFGFRSEGRFRVDMFVVKDFQEEFGETARHRLGNLAPGGLTRLGAVIRHATYRLENLPAAIKLMIILTDGRPYDLEYGDVNYAIMDTKKAIQEVRMKKISPFIITSDKKGASYLNQISPQMQSIILPKVELLPTILPSMYKRLTT